MTNPPTTCQLGIPEKYRDQAALLYDDAFGGKFALAIPSTERRVGMLTDSLDLNFGIAAIIDDELVGLAGIHNAHGSLTSGITYKSLVSSLGVYGGNRAALVFSLYERKLQPNELLMDGIAVRSDMRGRGIGSKLLAAVFDLAEAQGSATVRLDVIDTNPAARRLYERHGFKETKTEHFGYLRWLLGFGASTTMVRSVIPEKWR